jgi:hypothetical protein
MRVTTMIRQRQAERLGQVGDEQAGWPSSVSRAPTSASRRSGSAGPRSTVVASSKTAARAAGKVAGLLGFAPE